VSCCCPEQIKSEAFYQEKKAATAAKALAERKATSELATVNKVLESFGYHVTPTPAAQRIADPTAVKRKKAPAE
jgi:hypothetical protein